ncbi:MAG TPA: DUF58 domain-containing protein, partial [Planctomycetia bacterium]|nr:DUF58 domain-containing protein [Planctomycetia bacterium]
MSVEIDGERGGRRDETAGTGSGLKPHDSSYAGNELANSEGGRNDVLPPAVPVSRRLLARLVLNARRAAGSASEGRVARRRGQGAEFDELRPYGPGDDVRRIAWRHSALRGRTLVKNFLEDAARDVWLAADDSPSLRFGIGGATDRDGWFGRAKWRSLLQTAVLLARAAALAGDRIGLVSFGARSALVPLARGPRQAVRIATALAEAAGPPRGIEEVAPLVARLSRRRSIVVVLSDFLTFKPAPALAPIAARHETLAVRIVDPLEEELPDAGLIRVTDSGGAERLVDTSSTT